MMNRAQLALGTQSTKMGADKLAENIPNAPKFYCPICLPKPKRLVFLKKKNSLWVSVVCVLEHAFVLSPMYNFTSKEILLLLSTTYLLSGLY